MLRLFPVAMLSLLLGCDPKVEGGPTVCDPFAADQQPSKLREVLAVGRADDGRFYVVDHTWYEEHDPSVFHPIDPRVFVSEGTALRRVLHEGYLGWLEMQWTFPVARHDPSFTLVVTDEAGVRRMGVLAGTVQAEPFVIGEVGEELTLVDRAAIDGRAVYNFVGAVAVEYAARADDGRTVVVLGPENPDDYDHYRLFMGTDELVEYEVTSFVREKDGGTTTIDFAAQGDDAVAYFPTPQSPELSPTLTLSGASVDLVAIDSSTLDDAVYLCR